MSKRNIRIAVIVIATMLSAAGYAAAKGGGGGHGGGGHGGGGHGITAVMVAHISVVAAIVVGISAEVRTSAAVGATPSRT